MKSLIIATLIVGLFHFSEGKPCPEETRAHATRCDSYFRCVVLPSKSHVWVPTQCERGLIYEPDLRLCVLPGDDWECTLGETSTTKKDDNNIYGVNSLILNKNSESTSVEKDVSTGDIITSNNSDEEDYIEVSNVIGISNEGSSVAESNQPSAEESLEYSGDGNIEEDRIELKDGGLEIQDSSTVDPKLAAQLQRLSQIIGGLKQKYQSKPDANLELRPDQLNAFLAHYNIRSQFDAINPSSFDKRPVPEDGRIEPEVLQHIIRKQHILQKAGLKPNNSVTTPSISNGYVPVGTVPRPTASYTENKISLQNSGPEKYYRIPDGYSNSQIVVNKPEGSVLFSLPANEQYQPRPTADVNDAPRISEETLKTVLELSKQMITNQNIRQVVPNNAIYHSVVQPMYFPFPMAGSQQGNFYSDKYHVQSGYVDEDNYQVSSQTQPIREQKRKPSATVMQNNVLPLTTSQGSAPGMIPRPIMSTAASTQDTTSPYENQASDRIDSYGNKLVGDYQSSNEPDRVQFSYQSNDVESNDNSLYSTTLFPPLNYDLPPHVTPAAAQTPNPQYENSYFNRYNTRPNQTPAYAADPNMVLEMPKPMPQSQMQFLMQRPQHGRPQTHSNNRPQTLHPSDSYLYNEIGSFPKPPQLRPINPTAVNIRPNSFQTSASGVGASFDAADSADEEFADTSADSHFSYNQNNVNNMLVSDRLASNVDHSGPAGNSQLVNLGGNFISYDVYKNQILPLFGSNDAAGSTNKVEIITCATGVRLPNATDCTKYYVCSKKDGKVLSYSCPPYTGFNTQTHICDARTYAFCNPQAIYNRFTVSENRKIQSDAMQALEEAKKVRNEAVQAQNLANLIRLETQKTTMPQRLGMQSPTVLTNVMHSQHRNRLSQDTGQAASMATMLTAKPPSQMTRVKTVKKSKRHRVRCSEGAKLPDPESVLHYYICYKNSEDKLKRRKMECSAGLMFCEKNMHCTLPRKCNA